MAAGLRGRSGAKGNGGKARKRGARRKNLIITIPRNQSRAGWTTWSGNFIIAGYPEAGPQTGGGQAQRSRRCAVLGKITSGSSLRVTPGTGGISAGVAKSRGIKVT
jgi:hypothetical protein